MIRRQFIRRTLGVIAGAVCAPFVGKAAPLLPTGWPKPGTVDDSNNWFVYSIRWNPNRHPRIECYVDGELVPTNQSGQMTVTLLPEITCRAADPGAT